VLRRPVAWSLGAFALFGFLRRRQQPSTEPQGDPRAEELRRKLAESRAIVDEREEFEAAETTVDQAPEPVGDPEARRRAVHESGRAAAQRMRERS
jgi:hypothetical protein